MSIPNNIFNEEAFKKLDKEKLEFITKMFNDMYHKNADERLQILFTYGMEMRSKGIRFTKDETALLLDLFKVNLSKKDREKLEILSSLMQSSM